MVLHSQKTVFISVSAPVVIRNMLMLPGSVLERLLETGVRVILLVPKTAFQRMNEDFGRADGSIVVRPIELELRPKGFLKRFYNFFAAYLIFTDAARLLAWYGARLDTPIAGGMTGRALYPLKWLIAHSLGKLPWFKAYVMPRADYMVYRTRPHKNLFDTYRPDIVFLPDVLSVQDVSVLRESKRQNIKTLGIPGSWDHLPKRFEPLHADRLLVWAEPFKKEAIELQKYDDDQVTVVGVPKYDIFAHREYLVSRDRFMEKCGLDPKKKLIAFFSESSYAPDDSDIVDILVSSIRNGSIASGTQLFIRPYPAIPEEHERFDMYENEPFVYIDWIEPQKIFPHKGNRWYPTLDGLVHLMNLLYHADIVINTYSSVSIEASVFEKSIININFDGYKERPFKESQKRMKYLSHFKHVLATGGITQVNSPEEFVRAIHTFLNNPDANKENVLKLREKMCWKIDGKASERVANAVVSYLHE